MSLWLALSAVDHSHISQVGLKAATLGLLLRSNLPVAKGFCLTTEAGRLLLGSLESRILARATPEVVQDPVEVEEAAGEIRAWIEEADWPPSLLRALTDGLASLTAAQSNQVPQSWAVRTSLLSEELESALGSGAQRAVLGVSGQDHLVRAVGRCWGAPYTSRALYFRQRKKMKQTAVGLGVLVQPMLQALSAGVMFTADPLTGDTKRVLIDSIWGLGEPVTSARVTPDRLVLDKDGPRVLEQRTEHKSVRLDVAPGGGLVQTTVAASEQDAPSLDVETGAFLAELGKQVERLCQGPQEIEWCLTAAGPIILQARPIGRRK